MGCRAIERERGRDGERERGQDHKVKSILGLRKDKDAISMIYNVENYE